MGEGMARRTQQHEGSHEEENELADPPHGRHLISPQVAWSSSATDAWTTPEKLSPNDVEVKLGEPAYCVFPWSSTIFPARSTFMLKGEPRGLAERSFRIRSILPGAPMGTPSTVRMMSPPTASCWPLMLAMVSPVSMVPSMPLQNDAFSRRSFLAVLMVTTKPSPSLPPDFEMLWLTMPITSPAMLNIGPPELPVLMVAVVWRNSARGMAR